MPGIDYRQIRSVIPIERVLQLLHFQASWRRGASLRGFCPIHDPSGKDDRRCFSVDLQRNAFQCFRCGAKGNQLDLWRLVHKLPLYPATLLLCNKTGLIPPWLGTST
ncbi:MAG: CHC2 zinc finger domain-containing protein, partial [Pirellulaceae bacterium]